MAKNNNSKKNKQYEQPSVRTPDGFVVKSANADLLIRVSAALADPGKVILPDYPALVKAGREEGQRPAYGSISFWDDNSKRNLVFSGPETLLLRFAAVAGRAKAAGEKFDWATVPQLFPDLDAPNNGKPPRNVHMTIQGFEGAVHGNAQTLFNLLVGLVLRDIRPDFKGTVTLTTSRDRDGLELKGLTLQSVIAYLAQAGKLGYTPIVVTGPRVIGAPGLTVRFNGMRNRVEMVATNKADDFDAKALIYVDLAKPVRPDMRELAEAMLSNFDFPPEVRKIVFSQNGAHPQQASKPQPENVETLTVVEEPVLEPAAIAEEVPQPPTEEKPQGGVLSKLKSPGKKVAKAK